MCVCVCVFLFTRLLGYVFKKDTLMLPSDPHGKNGITLDDFLKF